MTIDHMGKSEDSESRRDGWQVHVAADTGHELRYNTSQESRRCMQPDQWRWTRGATCRRPNMTCTTKADTEKPGVSKGGMQRRR
jgi:hypothetical protein